MDEIPGLEPSPVRQAFAVLRPRDPHSDGPWPGQPDMRHEPAMRVLIDAPDDERRAHIIELVALSSAGQRSLFKQLPLAMLKLVAARRIALGAGDVDTLLSLVEAAAQVPASGPAHASDLVRPLLSSIEHAVAAFSPADVDRIGPAVDRAAASVSDAALAARIRALRGVPPGVRLDLIPLRDDFAPRMRSVLEFSGEPEAALAAFVDLVACLPDTGRPNRRWSQAAEAIRSELQEPGRLVIALLEALLFTEDTAMSVSESWAGGRVEAHLHYLDAANETNALGIVRFATLTPDPALPRLLGLLALKCIGKLAGDESGLPALRSPRVANACVQVIGELGLPEGVGELTALQQDVRHGGLQRHITAALAALG